MHLVKRESLSSLPTGLNIRNAQLPDVYKRAREALEVCERIDECQRWEDRMKALASYARQQQDEELVKTAMRIQNRATIRIGELLEQIPKQHGANQNISPPGVTNVKTRTSAAKNSGLSKKQQMEAMALAAISKVKLEKLLEREEPPTKKELVRIRCSRAAKETAQ